MGKHSPFVATLYLSLLFFFPNTKVNGSLFFPFCPVPLSPALPGHVSITRRYLDKFGHAYHILLFSILAFTPHPSIMELSCGAAFRLQCFLTWVHTARVVMLSTRVNTY